MLEGIYFQAALQQQYEVEFERNNNREWMQKHGRKVVQ